eukprot:897360-Amphidinium_carterae.2
MGSHWSCKSRLWTNTTSSLSWRIEQPEVSKVGKVQLAKPTLLKALKGASRTDVPTGFLLGGCQNCFMPPVGGKLYLNSFGGHKPDWEMMMDKKKTPCNNHRSSRRGLCKWLPMAHVLDSKRPRDQIIIWYAAFAAQRPFESTGPTLLQGAASMDYSSATFTTSCSIQQMRRSASYSITCC